MTFHFHFMGVEDRNIKQVGTVRALKFGVSADADRVFSGDDMYIWFSDDDNMVPVQFIAPIKVGLVEGRLSNYKGLKHPFESLIKK